MSNKEENKLIEAIDELDMYKQLQPAIKAAIKYGGGSDNLLRKSQTFAAARLIELLNSDRDDIKLKAASQILDRALGKAIERKFNIYGDLADLNEKDIDRQLKQLMGKAGLTGQEAAAEVIDVVVDKVTSADENT